MPFFFSKKPASVAQDLRLPRGVTAPRTTVRGRAARPSRHAVRRELPDDQEHDRGRGPRPGHHRQGDAGAQSVRARHQHEGLAPAHPDQHVHQPLPPRRPRARPLRGAGRRAAHGRLGRRDARCARCAIPRRRRSRRSSRPRCSARSTSCPDEFRLAVVLSDIEELWYKEIADAMGCPIGTVMSRLHRGPQLLQKTLREHAVAMGIVSEERRRRSAQEEPVEPRSVPRAASGVSHERARSPIERLRSLLPSRSTPYVDGELDAGPRRARSRRTSSSARRASSGSTAAPPMRLSLKRAVRAARRAGAACASGWRAGAGERRRRARGDVPERRGPRQARSRCATWWRSPPRPASCSRWHVAASTSDRRDARASAARGRRTLALDCGRASSSFVDELVDDARQPHPPETTNPEELPRFDPFVGVPVRLPSLPAVRRALRRRARARVRDRRAAALPATTSCTTATASRCTSSTRKRCPLQRPRASSRAWCRNRPVYVGTSRGYSVAAPEQRRRRLRRRHGSRRRRERGARRRACSSEPPRRRAAAPGTERPPATPRVVQAPRRRSGALYTLDVCEAP